MKKIFTSLLTLFLLVFLGKTNFVFAASLPVNTGDINSFKLKSDSVQVVKYTDKNIRITQDDIYLMAQVVQAESCGEPFEGKVAVASVILNRTVDSKFPNTIEQVIKEKGAFSCIDRYGNIRKTPDKNSYAAVMEALKGNDPTNYSLFFYNPKIATCKWMKNVSKHNKKAIGNHVFFKI